MKSSSNFAIKPPDSEPKRMPDQAGIWLKMDSPDEVEVYDVVFDPSAPLRLIARRIDGGMAFAFGEVSRDMVSNWWRVP